MNDIKAKEDLLDRAIGDNNTEAALLLLSELAAIFARNKAFKKAEQYRDRLYDIDPSALSIIIRTNELIEAEKTDGINPTHRELFSELYQLLTIEQGNALFYALTEITLPVNERLFKQGDLVNGLFFVTSGKLRVECLQGNRKIFIKFLLPGGVFGSETFFSSSLSTTSVIAFSSATLYKLEKDAFLRLKERFPGMEQKLKRYCTETGTVSSHVHPNMDRREKMRGIIFGRATTQFMTGSGRTVGKPLRVDLHDVSSGGISFLLRMSNQERADSLLGQRLLIQFGSETSTPPIDISRTGTIVAISPTIFDDYMFHVKFDKNIGPSLLRAILAAFSRRE